jgi:hypothetical protein
MHNKLSKSLSILESYKQFVIYELVPRPDGSGKTDKLPKNPKTGYLCAITDRNSYTDFNTAFVAAQLMGERHGVGFALTEDDPFFMLDIDGCWQSNRWSDLAIHLVSRFPGAAVEISCSGTGLHIIGTGVMPPHSCKNTKLGIELYHSSRLVALTDDNTIGNAAKDCTPFLTDVIAEYFPPASYDRSVAWTTEPRPEWRGPDDDDQLISRAIRTTSARASFGDGASFRDLWECNTEVLALAYPDKTGKNPYDASSADIGLALRLAFWTGANCERVKRLMFKSKLAREKWERESYIETTITKACAKQHEVYIEKTQVEIDPPANSDGVELLKPKLKSQDSFLSTEQQQQLFAGCIYVRERHAMLVPGGDLIKPDQFRVTYGGYTFKLDEENARVTRDPWKVVTESQVIEFPQAHEACFRPSAPPGTIFEEDGRVYANSWWPIKTKREVGDVKPFLDHIAKILPDEEDQIILISYMAACVQYPGHKFPWCVLLQGVEGNGKTLLMQCVAAAIGYRYVRFPRASAIADKFNAFLYGSLFVGIDDIYVGESQMEVLEILKPMIDRDRQAVEPKGVDSATREVCCNFMLNSNHKDALKKTRNDRRFATLYTAQQGVEDLARDKMLPHHGYFFRLAAWLKAGGYAYITEFLHTFKIPDDYNPTTHCNRAPKTSSTDDAFYESATAIEQEIIEAVEQGAVGFRGGWISSTYLNDLLVDHRADRRWPHNRRRDLLHGLGYIWHPGLSEGRVNNVIMPDGKKPRLFIKREHPDAQLQKCSDIAHAYSRAQEIHNN